MIDEVCWWKGAEVNLAFGENGKGAKSQTGENGRQFG